MSNVDVSMLMSWFMDLLCKIFFDLRGDAAWNNPKTKKERITTGALVDRFEQGYVNGQTSKL